jgi:hypothetical protein
VRTMKRRARISLPGTFASTMATRPPPSMQAATAATYSLACVEHEPAARVADACLDATHVSR